MLLAALDAANSVKDSHEALLRNLMNDKQISLRLKLTDLEQFTGFP